MAVLILPDTSAQEITVCANYDLSDLTLSVKHLNSGSILTWSEIILQGARVNVEFEKALFNFDRTNIGIGFAVSSQGHHVDDDSNNYIDLISVMSPKTALLNFSYETLLLEDEVFIPKIGFDFSYLKIENYDYRPYAQKYITPIEGIGSKYDVYKFGVYGGLQIKLIDSNFLYFNAFGQIGAGIYAALADWVHRDDWMHPVSFSDIGISFRGSSGLETGIRLGRFAIFVEAQFFYELSPGLGVNVQYHTDAWQFTSLSLQRASFAAGLRVRF